MDANRFNVNPVTNPSPLPAPKHPPYLVFFLIFSILSVIGILVYLQISAQRRPVPVVQNSPQELPTPTLTEDQLIFGQPLASPTEILATPTPVFQTYTATDNSFSVVYPSYRSVTIEKEGTGHRYVFYSRSGNITLHVGTAWSWQHPGREFTTDLTVAGLPTFQYIISTQTLTDFQTDTQNYTIQCVHGGQVTLKQECTDFIASFKILN